MDPSDMQQCIAEQDAMVDPERAALEALAAENHQNICYTIALSTIGTGRKCSLNAGQIISPREGAWAALGFLESRKILHT